MSYVTDEQEAREVSLIKRMPNALLHREFKKSIEKPCLRSVWISQEVAYRFGDYLTRAHWTTTLYRLLHRKNKCQWNGRVLDFITMLRKRFGYAEL